MFPRGGSGTSTDHGHLTAQTIDLAQADAERLFGKVIGENFTEGDAELFRARGMPPGRWSLAHDTGAFHLVAASGDRALGEGQRLSA